MSVPYISIFNKFNTMVSDSVLFSDLTDQEYTELLSVFLNKSKSLHFKLLKDDLTNVEEPDFHTETFEYEDINEFELSKYPNSPSLINLICKVNDENVESYEFNEETRTFIIEYDFEEEDEVVVGYDFYGQFNEDISDEVQWILATGMKLTWLERKIYAEENLRNHWQNKDYSIHSPANLLQRLQDLKKSTQKDFDRMKNSYTFNDFKGFN